MLVRCNILESDELVKEVHQKHHTVLRALKGHQQKGPGFYWAAAEDARRDASLRARV